MLTIEPADVNLKKTKYAAWKLQPRTTCEVSKNKITTVPWRCKKYSLWEGQKRKIFFIFKESAAFSFSIFQQMFYCALFLDCALLSTWNYTRWSTFFHFFCFALANFGVFFLLLQVFIETSAQFLKELNDILATERFSKTNRNLY